jgi:CubicO group peptidase (beta-lactamase class C family)
MGTMAIDGTCDDRFDAVRRAFEDNFVAGKDVGASVAVTVDGEMVVDLWGGTVTTDADAERPWERDTIINVWSTTKTMAALCCLVLIDRGELDPHEPIATYWPGFETAGKASVTTAHVLSHSAGLSGWDQPMTADDLYDWDLATELLAKQAPWWEPGTASGYHAVTQGYLLGEVVKRITGRSIGTFFAEEIAGPLGADFHIGTRAEHDDRVAHVIPPSAPLSTDGYDPASVAVRTLANPRLDAAASSTIPWRRAEIPAAGGHANARSVARIHSAVACGGSVDGVTLLSPATCDRIFEQQTYGQDLVLPLVLRLGLGFGLNSTEMPLSPNPRTCFWGGWGGSIAIIDLDARMSFGYVMNRMGEGTVGDDRGASLLMAVYMSMAG